MTHGAPTSSFMPPYVAHLGWTRVRLDRDLAWDEIAGVIADAHRVVAERLSTPRRSATCPRVPAAKARRSMSR
jgi:predicted DNA-binding protein (MmcQ/YjbR family)